MYILTAPFLNNFKLFVLNTNFTKIKILKANMNTLELILMMQIFLEFFGRTQFDEYEMTLQAPELNIFLVFYATYVCC